MTAEEYDKLTPEEQRIKVAELCGFKTGQWALDNPSYMFSHVRDYLNDLNACHEFEKLLDGDRQHTYEMELLKLDYPDWEIKVTHATAAQRCKAFVLTMTADPYATPEDEDTAADLGITVEQLRADRRKDDYDS